MAASTAALRRSVNLGTDHSLSTLDPDAVALDSVAQEPDLAEHYNERAVIFLDLHFCVKINLNGEPDSLATANCPSCVISVVWLGMFLPGKHGADGNTMVGKMMAREKRLAGQKPGFSERAGLLPPPAETS